MVSQRTIQLARPAPYDRNLVEKGFNYRANDVAPVGDTQRWTYTVPTGKKFIIGSMFVRVFRVTVATTAGRANSYQRDVTTSAYLDFVQILANTIADQQSQVIGNGSTYPAAEQLDGHTADSSGGATPGTCDFDNHMNGVEFDA